jgi:hypothetical protein
VFKKRKKLKIALIIFSALVVSSALFANWYVKKYGYKNLGDFISTYWSNKSLATKARYETLEINIKPDDFQKLEEIREKALKRGILIDEGESYVDVKLVHNGKKIKAKLRLKGHMTDHLQNKKWSFRIKTKKGDAFMGMKIFSIQHPGTRNYGYEWLYHQMIKQEGIIALNYDFIKVKVNGEDWGIYAVEEHFAQELVQHNERPEGPILRFNPDMYWSYRIAEHEKQSINMESASMQSANIEAYDDNTVNSDSALLHVYENGMNLLDQFRRRELKTSEVFDIEKLAKFHAIIDLVGGHRSLDWSDVKYFYNSITRKIEPVAYESFSVQPTDLICGDYHFVDIKKDDINNLHDLIFSDPVFFEKYISELKRIASKKWLDTFLKKNKRQLDTKLAIIFTEFAYKKFETDPYYTNIKLIQKNLNPQTGLHAYVQSISTDSLFIAVASTDALPFKVKSISLKGKIYVLKNTYIPSKQKNSTLTYTVLKVPLSDFKGKLNSANSFSLNYEVPGSGQSKYINVNPVRIDAYRENEFKIEPLIQESDLSKFNFIDVDKKNKIIRFTDKNIVLNTTLVIGKGYKVLIDEGMKMDLINGAALFSYSPVFVDGTSENPVRFLSSDKTGKGIILLSIPVESIFSYTFFQNFGGKINLNDRAALMAYESDIKINNCVFEGNTLNDICCFRNQVKINGSEFESTGLDALNLNYAGANVSKCNIINSKDDGLEAFGSVVKIQGCTFENIKGSAIYARSKTDLNVVHSKISRAKSGLEAKDGSSINSTGCQIEKCETGIKASKNGDVFGPSNILAKQLKQEKNKTLKITDKKSTITIIE